jgi:pre-mRNA-splicing factor SYF2/beta-D-xylosidase 4
VKTQICDNANFIQSAFAPHHGACHPPALFVLFLIPIVSVIASTPSPFLNYPCRNIPGPYVKIDICNPTLPIDVRVSDAISRMSLSGKINSLATDSKAIPSLGLDSCNWWTKATHGTNYHVRTTPEMPFVSNVALPTTTAMSFNRSLWKKTGNQIGHKTRACMNAGNCYSTFWAPVINLVRDPRGTALNLF